MNTDIQRIDRHVRDILGNVKSDITMVMGRFVIVTYQDFLPVEVLRPILQPACGDHILILMRNASPEEVYWATNCAIVSVVGKRHNPIEL